MVLGLVVPAEATDFTVGAIQGTLSWNGSPVTGLAANAAYGPVRIYANPANSNAYINTSTGSYSFTNIAVGTYLLTPFNASAPIAPAMEVAVTGASTTTADFDLTATAGEVTGTVTINGVPLSNPDFSLCLSVPPARTIFVEMLPGTSSF